MNKTLKQILEEKKAKRVSYQEEGGFTTSYVKGFTLNADFEVEVPITKGKIFIDGKEADIAILPKKRKGSGK